MVRQKPNVLICGTPGTGKSAICAELMHSLSDFEYINISEFCKSNECIESHDQDLDSDIIDEELMAQKLTPMLRKGSLLLDYHSADLFPKALIDFVFIIRCNNTILYDRLIERKYCEQKISSNIECEIFEAVVEEGVQWFGSEKVIQLTNECPKDLETNCATILKTIKGFKKIKSK